MDRCSVSLLLQVALVAIAIQSGLSVKCYYCNSNLDSKCGDPAVKEEMGSTECTSSLFQEASDAISKGISISNAMNLDIPQGQTGINPKFVCQKITIVDDVKKEKLVMRGCTLAASESGDTCSMGSGIQKMTGGHGRMEYCGTCEDDLCNGSSRLSFTAFFMLVPCAALLLSSL